MSPPPIRAYLKAVAERHRRGDATEHSYRGDLEMLLRELLPETDITNEPRRITDCGAPDYVLARGGVPLGYIEAKDVVKSLDNLSSGDQEQFRRYMQSLDNFILTNYLDFRLYRAGESTPVAEVTIAKAHGKDLKAQPANFAPFTDLVTAFGAYQGQTITTAVDLARRMADKARMLAQTIIEAFNKDAQLDAADANAIENTADMESALQSQLDSFRAHLIHDLAPDTFADIYAQTVAYGMFAARLRAPSSAAFTRREAAELIPSTNPFLRKFFQHIAGYELDARIRWIVDDLADTFRAADVAALMKDHGRATRQSDPFIHFYETFLAQYDPRLRKSRGVYYTPEPVVNFIVRAVDDILRVDFNLTDGLADTATTRITVQDANGDSQEIETHKVQILDPATGTGTFLAAIVKEIYARQFTGQHGNWRGYVAEHLLPRLNGFEVLMASYAMAHTKLEMVLRDHGCDLGSRRPRIFLTNALERHHPDTGTLFAQWLAAESVEADRIKRDTPVFVVIGNPPYSGESANKGEWITALMDAYKQEPGGGKLKEKNAKWLNDDYAKFIRCGQHFIDRAGYGVLAYINNHSFLDNITFRGMRWSLLQSFDSIYLIDLHGNSKKKEVSPDGSPDKNVFDIQQGVSINLFVKTGAKKNGDAARVFHHDLYGERESKYEFLLSHDLRQVKFAELKPQAPQYFFVPKDYALKGEYDKGFSVNDLFPVNSVGIVTARDGFTIYHSAQELKTAIAKFRAMDDESARAKFALGKDARDWKVHLARDDLEENIFAAGNDKPTPISYRPFDIRHTYYTGNSKGFHCMPRGDVMQHFIERENVGLIFHKREEIVGGFAHIFVSKDITEHGVTSSKTTNYQAPLYLYPEEKQNRLGDEVARKPNLNADLVKTVADRIGMTFTPEKTDDANAFAPVDILDYIYAVLHSPAYRNKFREFLKIDFPRVPYPRDREHFRALAKLGAELRVLHLMESPKLNRLITTYPEPGDNIITRRLTKDDYELTDSTAGTGRLGRVHINDTQYFGEVPQTAWQFPIGGYLPAQKYLKDRKDRALTWDEINHYQRMIVALSETAKLMKQIDAVA
ncbi:MAG: N-6 DNA methylase [Gammaproteobacteria bacterium]|nr:N-6 DNA methylase [Gammaproteobacteria bacterium]